MADDKDRSKTQALAAYQEVEGTRSNKRAYLDGPSLPLKIVPAEEVVLYIIRL